MPPKPKFTREEIVDAAYDMTKELGIEALTARDLGARLNASARPIFTCFNSMEEVKVEVLKRAKACFDSYICEGLNKPMAFRCVGEQYIKFAVTEPNLYKLIFLNKPEGTEAKDISDFIIKSESQHDQIIQSIMESYRMGKQEADKMFYNVCVFIHGLATTYATGVCKFDPRATGELVADMIMCLVKAYKEIPNLANGNVDRGAFFREMLSK